MAGVIKLRISQILRTSPFGHSPKFAPQLIWGSFRDFVGIGYPPLHFFG
jgi:hypothetical protein